MKFKFFIKKACWRPTLLGVLLILVLLILVVRVWMGTVCRFLSENEPVKAKTMVIEGWVEDYALKHAIELYRQDHYNHLIVTGLPLVHFEDYVMFPSTAAAAAAVPSSAASYGPGLPLESRGPAFQVLGTTH